jgi:hypothetical protein
MSKYVVEIAYAGYKSSIGILVEAKDENEARGLAQRHFLNTHPEDCIVSSHITKVDIFLTDIVNPSQRKKEEAV